MTAAFEPTAFQSTAFQTAEDAVIPPPNKYSRMMMNLLPPGKVWRLIGESLTLTLLAANADELGRLEDRSVNLLNEADPRTAVELLPEYESELELPSTGTNAERQARIVALLISQQGFRPVDFQTALAPLLGSVITVLERTHAIADAMGDDRLIFEFFIYRDPTLPGTYFLASAQALIDKIKPSHTIGYAIESIDFCCDDTFSCCDSDLVDG